MSEVRLKLTEADAIDAYRLFHALVLRRRRIAVWLPLMICALSGFYAVVNAKGVGQTIVLASEIAGVLVAIFTTLFVVVDRIWVPRRARRGFRQNHMLREEIALFLDDDGFRSVQASAQGQRPWSSFQAWAENRKTLLLLSTDTLFFFIPKHALDGDSLGRLEACLARGGVRKIAPSLPWR